MLFQTTVLALITTASLGLAAPGGSGDSWGNQGSGWQSSSQDQWQTSTKDQWQTSQDQWQTSTKNQWQTSQNQWQTSAQPQWQTTCSTEYYTQPVTSETESWYTTTKTYQTWATETATITTWVPYTTNTVETKTQCYTQQGWGGDKGNGWGGEKGNGWGWGGEEGGW